MFQLAKGGFPLPVKDFGNRATGSRFNAVIQIQEGAIQAPGQRLAHHALATSHEAD